MRKEDALSEIKTRFQGEITIYDSKVREYENKIVIQQLLEFLYDILSTGDIEHISENRLIIMQHFKYAYSPPLDRKMEDKFLGLIDYYNINKNVLKESFYSDYLERFNSKLKRFAQKIKMDLDDVKQENEIRAREIEQSEQKVKLARDVLRFLKNNIRIFSYTVDAIDNYMKDAGIEDTERVLVKEAIRLHNLSIVKNKTLNHSIAEDMINSTIEYLPISQEENKLYAAIYKESSLKMFNDIENADTKNNELDEILTYFPNHEDCEFGQFNYIFKIIINEIIRKIKDEIELIKNIEYYNDSEMRNVILLSYKEYVRKYSAISYYYQKEVRNFKKLDNDSLLKITGISKEEEKEKVDLYPNRKIKFYYATTKSGISYIERDLKDVPKENYTTIKNLLEGKMDETLSFTEDKDFHSNNAKFDNYSKLKDGQVRIVYRNLGQGKILILGTFLKKGTRDYTGYERCVSRDEIIDFEDAESIEIYESDAEEIEERMFDYIDKNYRKKYR